MMFALGTTLTAGDLRRVLARPAAFVVGLLAHTLLLPLVAFGLGFALPLETAVGLVIIASCPANATANLFTHYARGDTMLSVCLTAAASLVSVATLPLFVNLALAFFPAAPPGTRLPVFTSALGLFLVSTLPALAGMRLRHTRPDAAARVESRLSAGGLLLILAVIAAAIWSERDTVGPALVRAGAPALLLNVLTVCLAWGVSAAAGLERPQRVAVGLECGLQSFALAAFVCLTMLQRKALLLPGIAYGLTMWLSAVAVVVIARRRAFGTRASSANRHA
jgi:BASS family bile acid:Na+ symporter